MNNSEETLHVEDESIQEEEIHNLYTTFLNPSSEVNCDVCSFVAKNVQGLKIHMKAKHTISMKYKCTLCDFETNNKKIFNDHKASVLGFNLDVGRALSQKRNTWIISTDLMIKQKPINMKHATSIYILRNSTVIIKPANFGSYFV